MKPDKSKPTEQQNATLEAIRKDVHFIALVLLLQIAIIVVCGLWIGISLSAMPVK